MTKKNKTILVTASAKRLGKLIAHHLVREGWGVAVHYNKSKQLAELTSKIHGLRHPSLLIAVDHEGGRIQRFRNGFSQLPACSLFGAHKSTKEANLLAEYAGWLMSTELLSVGIDFSFAPVLDVGGNRSEVIGDRAFHTEPKQISSLKFAFNICKFVKSNAIVLVNGQSTIGIGAGQASRLDSCKIASDKAQEFIPTKLFNSVAASDAFFPFSDGIKKLIETGVKAIIQPGGSVNDKEIIKAADKAGIAMLFTGTRHFRH